MQGDISTTNGGQPLDLLQQEAQSGGRVIPLNALPMMTATTQHAPSVWYRAIDWKHVAIVVGVALVVWWVMTGEDPVETVKDVAQGATDATKEAAKAVAG